MPTTSDVLDQHLKIAINDAVVSIYAENVLAAAWVDLGDVLSDEWNIGALP
jgi:hypothetical protein